MGKYGPLPTIGAGGRQPWRVYARPFPPGDTRSRLAIVVGGLGRNAAVTQAAISRLAPDVTLSFSPYGTDLERWTQAARVAGHEIMMDLPLEPADFPYHDPGPYGLMASAGAEQNGDRLEWLLSRFGNYVGVCAVMGSRFLEVPQPVAALMAALKRRGLVFLDAEPHDNQAVVAATRAGVPNAYGSVILDSEPTRSEIDRRLVEAARAARDGGVAVAIAGGAYPVTIDAIADYAAKVKTNKHLVLAPVSALANKQNIK